MKYNIAAYELDIILIALDYLLVKVSKISNPEKEEIERINEIGNLRKKLSYQINKPEKQQEKDSNLFLGYLVVTGGDLNALEKKMAEKMQTGWQPYGNLLMHDENGQACFLQPIVHSTIDVDPAAYETE